MRVSITRVAVVLGLAIALTIAATHGPANAALAQVASPPRAWKVIPCGPGADIEEISLVVESLYDDLAGLVCWPLNSRSAIVVQCEAGNLTEIETAIRSLAEVGVVESDRETAVITCQHRSSKEMLNLIRPLLGLAVDVSADGNRNAIILRATPERTEEVRSLIETLDQPRDGVTVELMVLGPKETSSSQSPMPQSAPFAGIREELRALGLADYGIVSQSLVRTVSGLPFQISEQNAYRSLQTTGTVESKPNSNAVNLELSIQIELQEMGSAIAFKSNLSVGFGDRTVVGIAPTGEDGGQPLVLALRIRKS